MSAALVHIGTPKTGTTSFQEWAEASREALEQRGTHLYAGRYASSHVGIALLCMRADRQHRMKERLIDAPLDEWREEMTRHVVGQAAHDAPRLLVSSEDLSHLRYEDEVETLARLLAPRELRVAVCIRDPASFLESQRRDLQLMGLPIPDLDPRGQAVLWDETLAAWRTVLGDENVVAFSYEDAMSQHGSTIPGVLDALGIDPTGLPSWDDYFRNVTEEKEQQLLRRQRSPYRRFRRAFSKTRSAAVLRRVARREA